MATTTYISRPFYFTFDYDTFTSTYTSPSDYPAGDDSDATSVDDSYNGGDTSGSGPYGEVIVDDANVTDPAQVVGSQVVPNGDWSSITEQRLFVRYTAVDDFSFDARQGDGGNITVTCPATGTITTLSNSTTHSFLAFGLYSFPSYGATLPTIYDWWIETDITIGSILPPLRIHPRSDGLGASSAFRVYPPTPSIQFSNRQVGGFY